MGGGTKFAIAIVMLFLAMVAFFFAFHPGGVEGVSDPQTMLQWLNSQFNDTVTGATDSGTIGAQPEGTAPGAAAEQETRTRTGG